MSKYSRYSKQASLVATGLYMQQLKLWEQVKERVKIKQKKRRHEPIDKLLDAFINIMAGGTGVVEVNTLVKPDQGLQNAFGRGDCADQSGVSETLNACSPDNVEQMRQALQEIYHSYGQGYSHNYEQVEQVLDVDISGLPGGEQGEGVSKGYFRDQKYRRGRQLGRVVASLYDEVVVERLYRGNVQLERSLQALVEATETVLELKLAQRQRTIIRVDGGGGRDADMNWLLARGYFVVAKVKNWQRSCKLARSVKQWQPDPKVPERQVGWVTAPHPYSRATRQIAIRKLNKKGKWQYRILVFNLSDDQLARLAKRPHQHQYQPHQLLFNPVYVYDQRSGGVETTLRNSKQGLKLPYRTKRSFAAQEMLILLAQLAYLLILWLRNLLAASEHRFAHFGTLRMVRDVLQIPGLLQLDAQGRIIRITFNQAHCWAAFICHLFSLLLAHNDLSFHLRQI